MVQNIEQQSATVLNPVQVSPRSFKRQIEVILGALIQLDVGATILAKLPRGSSWSSDLVSYQQALNPGPDIFMLARPSSATAPGFKRATIPTHEPMQGEYFLVAIAPEVSILLVGEREDVMVTMEEETACNADQSGEEAESLPKVNYTLTLQKPLVQEKLTELQAVFQSSLAEYTDQPALEQLMANWKTQMAVPDHCHPAVIDAILLQQGDYQEQLQQKARVYRRQAKNASSLSTQNEALLNTLRLKDDFLNTVGQELRTPLSTIKTALPLLSSPNLKPPQRQRYLEMISRECDRQVNLINGVLELLQIERSLVSAKALPVKLFDILPGIVSTYQPIAQEKGIRLAYTVPNTLPAIGCPESWVRQIVIHLLNNSIRFTQSGGEVWVTAQENGGEMLTINVRDTGVGIPQNELPHIFEHFYRGKQTSSEDEGAGLGLSIVQQLLLYTGGTISVDSRPEAGTHFKVKLPIYQGPSLG